MSFLFGSEQTGYELQTQETSHIHPGRVPLTRQEGAPPGGAGRALPLPTNISSIKRIWYPGANNDFTKILLYDTEYIHIYVYTGLQVYMYTVVLFHMYTRMTFSDLKY